VRAWNSAARLALAVVALGLSACRTSRASLDVAGTVEIRDVQVAPLAPGRLARLLKDEGDTVRVGDTIAVLEQPGLDALIDERRAEAHAAASRTAEVAGAEADSARAYEDLARAERLRTENIISPQQYDALRTAAAASGAQLAVARAAPSESVAARAAVSAALATRADLTVLAPAAGVILTRYAEPGEVLAAGAPVVSLGLVARPWIRAYVDERDIGRLQVGAPAQVRVDAYPGRVFAGRITEIAPEAEFTPRVALTERERADLVFALKVEPTDGDAGGRLKAGMPVTVELPLLP
jgi:HlyD family secretion protein